MTQRVRFAIVLAMVTCVTLSACESDSVAQPELQPLTSEQVNDARQAASKWIGEGGQALFVCGQSDGLGLFTIKWGDGFQPDGMKDGRLVFILTPQGDADIIFRDATGSYLSAKEDTGEVMRISDGEVESWVIAYRSTGITETHNITTADGQLIDLWTSNKPTSLIGASAKLFKSNCVRA